MVHIGLLERFVMISAALGDQVSKKKKFSVGCLG